MWLSPRPAFCSASRCRSKWLPGNWLGQPGRIREKHHRPGRNKPAWLPWAGPRGLLANCLKRACCDVFAPTEPGTADDPFVPGINAPTDTPLNRACAGGPKGCNNAETIMVWCRERPGACARLQPGFMPCFPRCGFAEQSVCCPVWSFRFLHDSKLCERPRYEKFISDVPACLQTFPRRYTPTPLPDRSHIRTGASPHPLGSRSR